MYSLKTGECLGTWIKIFPSFPMDDEFECVDGKSDDCVLGKNDMCIEDRVSWSVAGIYNWRNLNCDYRGTSLSTWIIVRRLPYRYNIYVCASKVASPNLTYTIKKRCKTFFFFFFCTEFTLVYVVRSSLANNYIVVKRLYRVA